MLKTITAATITLLSVPAAAGQTASAVDAQEPVPSDDIVVEGLRDIDDPNSPVTRATLGSAKVGRGATESRKAFELAERFARCAVKAKLRGARELRGALDDTINSARQDFQQSRFVQLNAACAQDTQIAQTLGIASSGDGFPTRYYDRGALFLQAVKVYAPDLTLTKAQTADPVVQARFNARETTLARFRLAADRTYFETAICIVRLQPELSIRLIRATDFRSFGEIEAAMVNGARVCTGNAQKVYFDPSQFRFYIADALYRWTVAARNVGSLIPTG